MNLFTYGTLMFPEIWRRVAGREFACRGAKVAGYEVRRAAGELFPVLIPTRQAAAIAPGLAYLDIDAATLALIDEYEAPFYERRAVTARLDDGSLLPCEAYVLPEGHRRLASDDAWTAAWFEAEALDAYLARLGEWGL